MSKALVISGANFSTNKLATVTFEGSHTTGVSVSPSAATIGSIGGTQELVCTLTPSDSVDPVVWSSSNESIATVSSSGVVTSVGCGSCTITATSGSYSATCTITVSEYLAYDKYAKALTESLQSGNNYYTKLTCDVGLAATTYNGYMTMVDKSQTVPTALMCTNMAKNTASSGYNFEVMQPNEFESGTNPYRVYNTIGYPLPMLLPNGCTKIKCSQLNAKYGAYPLFFKSTTRALDTPENVNGGQYYCALRQRYTPTASDYTWVYEAETEFNVPEGFDAVVVSWRADPNDADAVLPVDMTAEQKAAFKVLCL